MLEMTSVIQRYVTIVVWDVNGHSTFMEVFDVFDFTPPGYPVHAGEATLVVSGVEVTTAVFKESDAIAFI